MQCEVQFMSIDYSMLHDVLSHMSKSVWDFKWLLWLVFYLWCGILDDQLAEKCVNDFFLTKPVMILIALYDLS